MTSATKHYQYRSCKHKNPYLSLKVGLDILLEKRKLGIDVDSVYECVFCGHYHIGHYPQDRLRLKQTRIIHSVLGERSKICNTFGVMLK